MAVDGKDVCGRAAAAGDGRHSLKLLGVVSPAVVSGVVSVSVSGTAQNAAVTYCLDGRAKWVGGGGVFLLSQVDTGEHRLQAVAVGADGQAAVSDVATIVVVPTINTEFSTGLTAYAPQASAREPLETLLADSATPGAGLTPEEMDARARIAVMYANFGIDVSMDYAVDQSAELTKLLPTGWAAPGANAGAPLSMRFSGDAPFYHAIPKDWPRVKLPRGYLKTVQLNTAQGGDGIGYGISVARADAPMQTITSKWYDQESTRKTVEFRISPDWAKALPWLEHGDRHMIFVDEAAGTFVSAYKVSVDAKTSAPDALFASAATRFDSLGDRGGSTAAGFSELPLLIEPGEASSDAGAIRHAIGGPVSRVWAARVYPATARDAGVMSSTNSCAGKGVTNSGLVPYGGVIQLDPTLDLTKMKLSRPALRILQAMQTYGYYVMDFGCADMDIYTAIPEAELMPYGGLYGDGSAGAGVQGEIARVIAASDLYVVPPMTKRAD
jgi:hypothetical protein